MAKNKGFTLVESLIVVVIISTAMVSGLVFNENLRNNHRQLERRYDAINLCYSQLEDLKELSELNWLDPDVGDTAGAERNARANIVVPEGFTLVYSVSDKDFEEDNEPMSGNDPSGADMKEITVKCKYPHVNNPAIIEVVLKGYFADKR